MFYFIIKALHIIFMVSYFAGIFYLVRIFVYYKDTDEFGEQKKEILRQQYVFMARRLWNIITVPAFVIMLVTGILMIFYYIPNSVFNPTLFYGWSWFYFKIFFLLILFYYHYWCWRKVLEIKKLEGKSLSSPNIKLRQFNEIATFLLFAVVFLAVLKQNAITYGIQLSVGFFALITLITLIVKFVNKNKK